MTTIRNRRLVDILLCFRDWDIVRGTAALSFKLFSVKENKNLLRSIGLLREKLKELDYIFYINVTEQVRVAIIYSEVDIIKLYI